MGFRRTAPRSAKTALAAKAAAAVVAASGLLLPASDGAAHHPITPNGVNQTSVANRAALSFSSAPFELDDGSGQWWTTSLGFEVAPIDRFALLGRVGVATVRHSDGHTFSGVTDSDVGFKVALWSSPEQRVQLLTGAMLELPTGDVEQRLGGGHYELAPAVLVQWQPLQALSLLLEIRGQVSLDSAEEDVTSPTPGATANHTGGEGGRDVTAGPSQTDEPEPRSHGSWLAPHAANEIHWRMTAGYRWRDLYASVSPDLAVQLAGDEPLGPLLITPEMGVFIEDDWRLSAQLTLPAAGPKRTLWTSTLEFVHIF